VSKSNESWLESVQCDKVIASRSVAGIVLQFAQAGVVIISAMLLARVLDPRDYGVFATIIPVVAFAQMLKDFGITVSIFQSPSIGQEEVTTYFWIQVLLGFVLGIAVAMSGPLLAKFFEDSRLALITLPIGATLFIGVIGNVHNALLRRNLLFKHITVIQVSAVVLGLIAAVAAGMAKFGYWALVIQQAVIAVATLVGLWTACCWRPGLPALHRSAISGLVFGGALTMGQLCDYFRRNVDIILIRKFADAIQLGYYDRAQRMVLMPVSQLMGPVMSVALPMLSRYQDKPDYHEHFENIYRFCVAVAVPVGVFTFFFPGAAVGLLLGQQWMDAVPIMQGLAIVAIFGPIGNCLSVNLLVFRRIKTMLIMPAISMVAAIIAYSIGIQHSVARLAEYYGIAVGALIPIYLGLVVRLTPISGRRLLVVTLPLAGCMIAGVAGAGAAQSYFEGRIPLVFAHLAQAASFAVVYTATLLFFAGYLGRVKKLIASFTTKSVGLEV